MKDKNVAGILALFFGALGIHRFYLGQIGLGILYLFFFWFTWFLGLIDAIAFFAMDKDDFDFRYNRLAYPTGHPRQQQYTRREEYDYRRSARPAQRETRRTYAAPAPPVPRQRITPPATRKPNPFTHSGLEKFKDFDYDGAIKDFEKALEFDPKDVALHWNLACAYSLSENAEKAFFHLDRAVMNGFNDIKRIKEHDALAYLRIQKDFENFEKNGFRLVPPMDLPAEPEKTAAATAPEMSPDLLDQLNKLGSLREKGLLTEEEFSAQKRKLLG
ncbi:MAG: NINE protein [Lewinellaceae bacterium]|nr:NINE protein [Lewinella sp.]MCB9277925.1 NINE protein [Lewinellaceae bacterium]